MNPVLWIGAGAAVSIVATVVALFLLDRGRARVTPGSWEAPLSARDAAPAVPGRAMEGDRRTG